MVTKRVAYTALEALFVLCALVGVWLVYPPAALILAGVTGAVAVERASADLNTEQRRRSTP
ncbi:hypothetical protein AB0E27_24880 [Streptomyces sparsogenes]|uniref:hypothetical protein n=1 Tax=Streptomyces sparsogenes TaxID=67365 RepID=UPI0033C751CD